MVTEGGGGGGQERGTQWSPTKCEGGGFLWPKYRILVCKIFYHNVHFTLSLERWYLKQPFLVWTLTKPSYVVLSRDYYFNRFCARASWVLLITTMSTSYWVTHLHIGVPLKTRLHELKGKKFQMKIVCSFLILSLGPKKYSYSYTEVSRLPEESVAWIWSLVDSRNELWGDVPLKLSPGSTSWLSIWKISGRRSSGFVIGASLLSEFWLKSLFHDNHEVKKTRAVKRAVLNSPSAVSLPLNDSYQ